MVDNLLYLHTLADSRELAGQMAQKWAAVVAQQISAQSIAIIQIQYESVNKIVETTRTNLQDCQGGIVKSCG